MRIGQITGGINLIRSNRIEDVLHDYDIILPKSSLLNSPGFVKLHSKEVDIVRKNAAKPHRRTGLASARHRLNALNFRTIDRFQIVDEQALSRRIVELEHRDVALYERLLVLRGDVRKMTSARG